MRTDRSELDRVDVKRHWCPKSEAFAGGDAIASMVNTGWRLKRVVSREHRRLSGTRKIMIYLIELEFNGQRQQVHVICNPYVTRMLTAHGLQQEASCR